MIIPQHLEQTKSTYRVDKMVISRGYDHNIHVNTHHPKSVVFIQRLGNHPRV